MNIDIRKIIQAAEAGGEVLKQYFGQVLEIEEKSNTADFRTKADLASEQAVLNVLSKYFPDFNIYSEELGKINKGSKYQFVIDPLDGSNNFVLGIPNFTVAIALFKNDEIIAAAICVPVINKTFWAKKGKGAFFGNKKIFVNSETNLKRATISYTRGYIKSIKQEIRLLTKLTAFEPKRILRIWSPEQDFCMLADGKIEAIINDRTEIYDFAAGKLIAKEAGARITDFKGKKDFDKNDQFLISNGTKIHQEILKFLK